MAKFKAITLIGILLFVGLAFYGCSTAISVVEETTDDTTEESTLIDLEWELVTGPNEARQGAGAAVVNGIL